MASRTVPEEWLRRTRRSASARDVAGRAWAPLLAGVAAGVAIIRMSWDVGGYFPPSYLSAGAIAFGACGLLLVLTRPRYVVATNALLALGALAGLAAWTGLSALWSPAPERAIEAMQRDLVYLGLLGLGLLAAGSGRYARQLVWGVLAVVLIVCGASLLSRVYPDVVATPDIPSATLTYRLAYPLTYWNALGAMAAVGTVLAFGLSADPRTPWPLRGLAAGIAVLLLVTMSLSVSRGAWLALFAGLVVVIVMSAHRGSLLVAGAIVGIAAVTAITRLHAYPALTDDPLVKPGQLTAGHRYAAQLLVIVGVATAAQSVVAAGRASTLLMRRVDRLVRPLAIGAAVVVAVVLAAGYAWKAADAEGEASKRLHSASAWVSRQWRDFMRPAALTDTGSARLSSSKGTRSDLYRVAIDGFEAHPLRGDGAGGFPVRWFRTRDVGETVRNAHSLEFETLGELGIIGVLLLCAFLGSIGAAILLARMHAGGLAGSQVAAVAGAFTVWLVHSFVDWDWQVTALTGIVLVLAASAFPYGRGVRRRESPRSFELMEDVRAESSR